jgi:predicted HTH transcriptional regulator
VIFNFEEISIEQKVLELIKKDSKITGTAIRKELKISDSTVKRILKSLQVDGIIQRSGNNRSGVWTVL